MKLALAFLSLLAAFAFSACSTSTTAPRKANLTPCCASREPAKEVLLQDSFAPGGRVVRLAPPSGGGMAE